MVCVCRYVYIASDISYHYHIATAKGLAESIIVLKEKVVQHTSLGLQLYSQETVLALIITAPKETWKPKKIDTTGTHISLALSQN